MRNRQGRQPLAVSGSWGGAGGTFGSGPVTPGRGRDQLATRPASGGGALTAAARASATRGPGPMGTGAPASRTGPVSGAPAGAPTGRDGPGITGSCEGGGGSAARPPLRGPAGAGL